MEEERATYPQKETYSVTPRDQVKLERNTVRLGRKSIHNQMGMWQKPRAR